VYRDSVERITKFRLKVCEENEDCRVIEQLVDDGLVEDMIVQAKAELELIPEMNGTFSWQV
jgi:hypothetical protein